MVLEEKQFFLPRWTSFYQLQNKEWWYTGIYAPDRQIYLSYFFIRVNLIDYFNLILYDPALPKVYPLNQYLYLTKYQEKNKLNLNYSSKKLKIAYNTNNHEGWTFQLNNQKYDIDLEITPTTPYFTQYNNQFVQNYTFFHYFHNSVNGFIKTPDKTYELNNALGYYDHYFGKIPRHIGWHWLAVQNRDVAFVSSLHYGPYPQRYTQIYLKSEAKWFRLSQEVKYEYNPSQQLHSDWNVTSFDLDLTVTPIMAVKKDNKIPPLLPFMVNIKHTEFFVKVSGKVRIDDKWITIHDLYGVMEEHYGKW